MLKACVSRWCWWCAAVSRMLDLQVLSLLTCEAVVPAGAFSKELLQAT